MITVLLLGPVILGLIILGMIVKGPRPGQIEGCKCTGAICGCRKDPE